MPFARFVVLWRCAANATASNKICCPILALLFSSYIEGSYRTIFSIDYGIRICICTIQGTLGNKERKDTKIKFYTVMATPVLTYDTNRKTTDTSYQSDIFKRNEKLYNLRPDT